MAVDVTTEISIDVPLTAVYQFTVNPDNAPLWYENIKTVQWENEPPVQIGSRITFSAQFLGRTLKCTYEIVDLAVEQLLVMRASQGPFPMETTYIWQSLNPYLTPMTLRNRGQPSGFTRTLQPFLQLAMKKANRKDLHRLKTVLESKLT